jgi:hypothetical protein
MFREASCKIFGIIESYFVGNFRYIHILRFPILQNQFPSDVQSVIPDELSGGLTD